MSPRIPTALVASFSIGVAVWLACPRESLAFAKLGSALAAGDARVFRLLDNFSDPEANDDLAAEPMFPGWTGSSRALWKAAVEWGSGSHGDGSGDPTQHLGDGGADFDFVFGGAATSAGAMQRVAAAVPDCGGGGVYGYVLASGSGWSALFCDEWVWSDGPDLPANGTIDLQGIGCHEFGHALGLGHSGVGGSAMIGVTTDGFDQRDLGPDDIAGLACLYGAAPQHKPTITGITVDPQDGTLTIVGAGFDALANEVWFTNETATDPGADPRILVSGLPSPDTTTLVVVPPPEAGDGDVHVRVGGGPPGSTGSTSSAGSATPGDLSNGWPVDLAGGSGASLHIAHVTPSVVPSLQVGPDRTVAIAGGGFGPSTQLRIDGVLVDPSRYDVVHGSLVLVDLPQVSSLGPIDVQVDDGTESASATLTVVAPATPVLQVGNGLPFASNTVRSSDGLPLIFAGTPGELHYVLYSSSNAGSSAPIAQLCIGVDFLDLFEVTNGVIGSAGYEELLLPIPSTFAVLYFQSLSLSQGLPIPVSNCQEALLLP